MVDNGENTHRTINPALGLLIFSIVSGLASWGLKLAVLLVISLPLFILFIGVVLSGNGFRGCRWLLPVLLGGLCSSLWATHYYLTRLDERMQGKDIVIRGTIASLPVITGVVTRFDVDITPLTFGYYPEKVRLSWFAAPELKVGQGWELTVKLRQPHGFSSPGTFDYEAWLLRQGIQATGYVKSGTMLNDHVIWKYRIQQLRACLKQWLHGTVSDENRGLFSALLLGDKSVIQPGQWQVFSETGTTHLMVISGLHIGLMAWLGFSLAAVMGRAGGLPLRRLPLPAIKAVTGMVFAFCYASLAGFSVPVQRALVMTFTALLAPLLGIRASPLTLWLLALATILAIDPLALTSPGLWYSFMAVAALIFGMVGRLGERSWQVRVLRPQWLVFLLLTPLLLFNGQPVSPLSPLVNLLAIPFIGVCVVPLLLFSAFLQFVLPEVASIIITGLDYLVSGFQWGLQWVSGLMVFMPSRSAFSWLALLLAIAGVLLLLSPMPSALRCLAPVLLMPLVFPGQSVVPVGQAEVTVLDVGQGLSVLIRTHRHLLVYDTGDRFSERMSAARSVILPALSAIGAARIDRIVISHGDQDHAGGLQPLLSSYQNTPVISGTDLPDYHGLRTECRAGDQWHWDGVHFEILSGGEYRRSNDASCLLKVTAGTDSLLLPGDISERVERKLLASGADLQASVLVAAHHGSRFSSSPGFLAAVQPRDVIFSSGFANRFGHPAPETVQRVRETGAQIYITALDGSLFLTLGADESSVSSYRKTHSRYWWR